MRRLVLLAVVLILASSGGISAQPPDTPPPPVAAVALPPPVAPSVTLEPSDDASTLVVFNREILTLRARVLGRRPAERARNAEVALDDVMAQHIYEPVTLRTLDNGILISVGTRNVLMVAAPDVDPTNGETLQSFCEQGASRLRVALKEAADARRPALILRSLVIALAALIAGGLVLWGLQRIYYRLVARIVAAAEKRVARAGLEELELFRKSSVILLEQRLANIALSALALTVVYVDVTFVLRQFPYTRPWGESMRSFLIETLQNMGLSILGAIPSLFTVVVFVVIARLLSRGIHYWFTAIEQGRLYSRWIHQETAQPTRRLLITLLWLFTIVVSYPYLPGSQTEAFKGISVFVGLMITFGSSGLMNQIASGFMITYSRALRIGDFARIGDVEGTVTHLGVLSTKLRTVRDEEVTVPNAVVISQTTTDYSRTADAVFTPTTVTIGYDTPWRQVQALLLMAAERTPGLRAQPKPFVVQEALEDFYVRYTLMVCLEHQQSRLVTFNLLHAHIQDLFNEYGVQIMSPNYVIDPKTPKLVAKKDWTPAPANPDPTALSSR